MIAKVRNIAIAIALCSSALTANAAESATRVELGECAVPTYRSAWDDEVTGTVRLAVLIGSDGSVREAKVIESSGDRMRDRASLHASTSCKFTPASKDSATPVWAVVQYKWILN
ncbi:TonB family protein [Duganella violaceipulchra]|uniref:Energy transducer TonB n=1 Tax=Duganella violaceipulchra TaxID=2849652 RepID=A0AA41H7V0_9BURK|nr:TonB family protein [Duganella violaceicalia]MBV6321421.1 energy transducer TonB [Duganella violaceicalia]MCP2009330.1 protein TonB [Duganella violaceicalia]